MKKIAFYILAFFACFVSIFGNSFMNTYADLTFKDFEAKHNLVYTYTNTSSMDAHLRLYCLINEKGKIDCYNYLKEIQSFPFMEQDILKTMKFRHIAGYKRNLCGLTFGGEVFCTVGMNHFEKLYDADFGKVVNFSIYNNESICYISEFGKVECKGTSGYIQTSNIPNSYDWLDVKIVTGNIFCLLNTVGELICVGNFPNGAEKMNVMEDIEYSKLYYNLNSGGGVCGRNDAGIIECFFFDSNISSNYRYHKLKSGQNFGNLFGYAPTYGGYSGIGYGNGVVSHYTADGVGDLFPTSRNGHDTFTRSGKLGIFFYSYYGTEYIAYINNNYIIKVEQVNGEPYTSGEYAPLSGKKVLGWKDPNVSNNYEFEPICKILEIDEEDEIIYGFNITEELGDSITIDGHKYEFVVRTKNANFIENIDTEQYLNVFTNFLSDNFPNYNNNTYTELKFGVLANYGNNDIIDNSIFTKIGSGTKFKYDIKDERYFRYPKGKNGNQILEMSTGLEFKIRDDNVIFGGMELPYNEDKIDYFSLLGYDDKSYYQGDKSIYQLAYISENDTIEPIRKMPGFFGIGKGAIIKYKFDTVYTFGNDIIKYIEDNANHEDNIGKNLHCKLNNGKCFIFFYVENTTIGNYSIFINGFHFRHTNGIIKKEVELCEKIFIPKAIENFVTCDEDMNCTYNDGKESGKFQYDDASGKWCLWQPQLGCIKYFEPDREWEVDGEKISDEEYDERFGNNGDGYGEEGSSLWKCIKKGDLKCIVKVFFKDTWDFFENVISFLNYYIPTQPKLDGVITLPTLNNKLQFETITKTFTLEPIEDRLNIGNFKEGTSGGKKFVVFLLSVLYIILRSLIVSLFFLIFWLFWKIISFFISMMFGNNFQTKGRSSNIIGTVVFFGLLVLVVPVFVAMYETVYPIASFLNLVLDYLTLLFTFLSASISEYYSFSLLVNAFFNGVIGCLLVAIAWRVTVMFGRLGT